MSQKVYRRLWNKDVKKKARKHETALLETNACSRWRQNGPNERPTRDEAEGSDRVMSRDM
jgi:hypothetical protein